jgi:unsaturated rhamnogalacturonyl hydrolase
MPTNPPSATLVPQTWSVRMINSVLQRYPLAQAAWHYEQGLVVKGIAQAGQVTPEAPYTKFARAWVDHFVTPDGNIQTYRLNELNLDQINPGKLLFPLYQSTGAAHYRQAIELLRDQLRSQPRTPSGGFWHKQIYPNQMWLDGLYMAGPFYAEYGRVFGEAAAFDDVAHQILLLETQARDPKTGLLYHAWDENCYQYWADPETGCSPHFWGRAMGWFVMALVDVLDHFPQNHPKRPEIIAALGRACQALLQFQDKATGLWYQVLDLADQPGNYREASASAMFIYAFAKGVRTGLLPPTFLDAARRGFRGLLENHVKVDAQGLLNLEGICGAAGLGGKPYRDGSYTYYTTEKIITNDFKGVGAFILAALELEAAYRSPRPAG